MIPANGISKFGLLVVVTFLAATITYRFLLPFGDEPDFTVRAPELVFGEHPTWVPYFWARDSIASLSISSSCALVAEPTMLWAQIDSESCAEDFGQIFKRFALTILVTAPIFLLVVFRGVGRFLVRVFGSISRIEFNARADSLCLGLLVPGTIYYLGLLSHEQLSLSLSFLVFLFWGNWVIVLGLILLISGVDVGNSVVVASFVMLYWVTLTVQKCFGGKSGVTWLLTLVTFAFFSGFQVLSYFPMPAFLEVKALDMLNKALTEDFAGKYPIVFRPIITFMTGTFMTASGIKVIPVYILLGGAYLLFIGQLVKRRAITTTPRATGPGHDTDRERCMLAAVCAFSLVLAYTFFFPDYSNAKYFMFLVPFFIRPALIVYSKLQIFLLLAVCVAIVPIWLVAYRL